MTISIIHPSHQRPELAYRTYKRWMESVSGRYDIDYVLTIDTDDESAYRYTELFSGTKAKVCLTNSTNLVEASNMGAKYATGDILILVSDDFSAPENWDELIVNATAGRENWILKVNDGIRKDDLITLPIIDRLYYEEAGYLYNPSYEHQFVDNDMTERAKKLGRMIVRDDLVFPHLHWTQAKAKRDETYIKAEKSFDSGQRIFMRRRKENFK